ncbi:MAG: TonB-dependent receptor [Lyngbya sp. HA4199-MV5]|nr:TonB-dependent receptor [Lyngbya sp. HA4199-MV5]
MKPSQFVQFLCWWSIVSLIGTLSAQAETPSVQPDTVIPRLREVKQPAKTVKAWLAQVETATVTVTGVKLERTEAGLDITLETTDGKPLQIDATKFRTEGNSLIADIPRAMLSLPNAQEFSVENPTSEIANVRVTQEADSLRVTVTGNDALPRQEVTLKTAGLAYSLNPEGQTPEEELVVTGAGQRSYFVPNATAGTRTDTPLRDVPQSIQVIPQQIIREQQVTRLDEALRNVSGVTATNFAGGFTDFTIRGFSGAPILRDGFRQYDFFQSIPETANLERIEVLKGPASILYGEIQPGGAINVVSKKPLSNPFYEAELQVGSRGFVRPRIDFSGPITADSKLLYRVNALFQNDDGFRGFDQNTQRTFVAPVLTWKISDRTDLTFELGYINDKRPLDAGLVAVGTGVVKVPRDRVTNEPADESEQKFFNIGYNFEHRFSNNWKINNAFRFFKQRFISDFYFPIAFDETTRDLLRIFTTRDLDFRTYSLQTNVTGKFNTGSIAHTLLFGVDLSRQTERFFGGLDLSSSTVLNIFDPIYGASPRPNLADIPVLANDLTSQNRLGIFLQDQVALLDNVKLLAGVRYDTVKQTRQRDPNFFNPINSESTQNNDAVTPRVGLVYQPIPELSLYGSYSRSFNPNSGTTVSGAFLEPEKGRGYEFGVKAELLRSKLFATLAYYNITKQNVATADPVNPDFSIATGEQRSRGVEFDLSGEILPGWNIIAAYAYTDAEITKDSAIPIGNRLVGVSKNNASLWTTYTIQSGNLQGLGVGFGFNYVGNREGDLGNSYRLGDYFVTNAAIFYRKNNYRLAVNIKNLFNIDYFVASNSGSRTSGIEPGAPLTVIGSFSVEF